MTPKAKRRRAVGSSGPASSHRADHVVSATEAAKSFGALVDRVRDEGRPYVIERGGVPVAQLAPAPTAGCRLRDVLTLVQTLPRLDEAYLREVEAGIALFNRHAVPEDPWAR